MSLGATWDMIFSLRALRVRIMGTRSMEVGRMVRSGALPLRWLWFSSLPSMSMMWGTWEAMRRLARSVSSSSWRYLSRVGSVGSLSVIFSPFSFLNSLLWKNLSQNELSLSLGTFSS